MLKQVSRPREYLEWTLCKWRWTWLFKMKYFLYRCSMGSCGCLSVDKRIKCKLVLFWIRNCPSIVDGHHEMTKILRKSLQGHSIPNHDHYHQDRMFLENLQAPPSLGSWMLWMLMGCTPITGRCKVLSMLNKLLLAYFFIRIIFLQELITL